MKKIILTVLILPLTFMVLNAQKYMTRSGYIGFYSHTPVEDIKADNNQVASILDLESGELVFQVLMRSFRFEKKLMEEHFNENYVESEKFPKATFNGKISGYQGMDIQKNGKYDVTVVGELTLHGVSREVSEKGTITINGGKIEAQSVFIIKPEDYNIEIPKIVSNKIAREIEVTVKISYDTM
ncbi:MAG: YceI family protein [Bacteroidales bacterium]|nr:YceI family protein [Bacteroidales bacterium]